MRKISIKNIYLILVISIGLIILGIGSTYAMFTASGNIDNPISLSSNLTYSSDVFESFDITLSSKENKTIKFNVSNNTNISSINYASWYIYDGDDTDLTFYTIKNNSTDIEPSGTLSSSGIINIKIVNNTSDDISLTVGVSSSKDNIVLPDYMKLITINEEKTLLVDYITNLYTSASKSTVTNNSITYNYASSVNLMNDRLGGTTTDLDGGNIRYYGASPNNYIYFNCEEYPDTNCELWRIIGVFNNQVKIIRNEQIGAYSWDNKNASTGAKSANGKNEWATARLMKLLNPSDYYTIDTNDSGNGQSLYWNAESGTCFSGQNNATKSCDFTSTGLKNDTTRNMIEEVTWNLGGYSSNSVYSNQTYGYERGTTVYSGRSTTWIGKVALPYPSDYGYATDFNKCTQNLYNYNSRTDSYACRSNDWMYPILGTSNQGWLLTPYSSSNYDVWSVQSDGMVYTIFFRPYNAYGVAPTLFLNSTETIVEGTTGTEDNPFKLEK